MGLLVLLYLVLSVTVGGSMVFRGMAWPGIALIIGSIIGFFAGGGARGAIYLKQLKSGIAIGVVLLIFGTALVFYSGVTMNLLGVEFTGDIWVVLGALIGWFSAKPEHTGLPKQQYSEPPSSAVE